MNKMSLAIGFASVAAVLAGVLLFLEVYKPSSEKPGLCRVSGHGDLPESEQLKWMGPQYFVSHNKQTGALTLNAWSLKDGAFVSLPNGSMPLICEKPDYNCFNGKASDLDVVAFTPPVGLGKMQVEGQSRFFPFMWDSKSTLRLGSPLRVCQAPLQPERSDILITDEAIFVFERWRSLLIGYNISEINGTVPKAAEREPDYMFQVSADGVLIATDCAAPPQQLSNFIGQADWSRFVLQSKTGVLRIFAVKDSPVPVLQSVNGVKWVLNMDKDALFALMQDQTVAKIGYDGQLLESLKPVVTDVVADENLHYWPLRNEFIQVKEPKWLGDLQFNVNGEILPADRFAVHRGERQFKKGIQVSQSQWVYVSQYAGKAADFSVVTCN